MPAEDNEQRSIKQQQFKVQCQDSRYGCIGSCGNSGAECVPISSAPYGGCSCRISKIYIIA